MKVIHTVIILNEPSNVCTVCGRGGIHGGKGLHRRRMDQELLNCSLIELQNDLKA